MKAIRHLYEAHGAESYYREHSGEYANPHYPQIEALLAANMHRLDCSGGVLDFSAGGGEVTRALAQAGIFSVTGCDPFTHELYEKNTGRPCLRYSFKDIIRGAQPGSFSLIISSFALHLCPPKDLFPLCQALFFAAPTLVVITPHKRPELEQLPAFQLLWEDAALTERGKKVRLKTYALKD
ncbi:MAG TPA: class I SAM-dependent methyltransferase [Saprospiraceae bacterium]|nr:class I SAM-dependent methyltransferase [Saprospiraceae bacterium]